MHEERLLERIRSIELEPSRRGGNDRRLCIDSVLSHLRRLLNTRQGNVLIAADYGIPDFLHFLQSYPESVQEIEQNIKKTIDKFEPRLSETKVTFLPDEDDTLILRFRISAGLAVGGDRQIYFETVLDTDGRMHIHK